jgi:hypothetical protein
MTQWSGAALDVAALVSGKDDPSSRFRVLQHVPRMERLGVRLHPLVPRVTSYPPRAKALRPVWGAAALLERLGMAAATLRRDMTLIQRTMISTFATFEGLCRGPRVFDVDDAIHLRRDGKAARHVARLCDLVICGNDFLAEWYSREHRPVAVLPTAVDTERWVPAVDGGEPTNTAGWIGSASNLPLLEGRSEEIGDFLRACPGWRLRVVCDQKPRLGSIPADRWEFAPWSAKSEVSETARFSIGLMPLRDDEWARGKCSYKMLLYMSCGVPVVVSPIGLNADILSRGACGVGATSSKEWTDSLVSLARDASARARMGSAGRAIVMSDYSQDVIAPKLARLLLKAAGRA